MQMQWDNSLEIGINIIDQQHKEIIAYINQLHDVVAVSGGRDINAISEVLAGLISYTETHFAYEEELLDNLNYPFTSDHKKIHQAFGQRMRDYQERFLVGEDVVEPLLVELQSWLRNHIQTSDQHYAEHCDVKQGSKSFLRRALGKLLN